MQIVLSVLSCLAVLVFYEVVHELLAHTGQWLDSKDQLRKRLYRKYGYRLDGYRLDRLTRRH